MSKIAEKNKFKNWFLHFLPCSAISPTTALFTTGDVHSSSKPVSGMPSENANSFKCFGFGTTNATVKYFDDSPYTQILSIIGHVFNCVSTFPSDTYSPACNFTKSFLRSIAKIVFICNTCMEQLIFHQKQIYLVQNFKIYQ